MADTKILQVSDARLLAAVRSRREILKLMAVGGALVLPPTTFIGCSDDNEDSVLTGPVVRRLRGKKGWITGSNRDDLPAFGCVTQEGPGWRVLPTGPAAFRSVRRSHRAPYLKMSNEPSSHHKSAKISNVPKQPPPSFDAPHPAAAPRNSLLIIPSRELE